MERTTVMCPICRDTYLFKSKISNVNKREVEGTIIESKISKPYFICYSCKKTFLDEALLKRQSKE